MHLSAVYLPVFLNSPHLSLISAVLTATYIASPIVEITPPNMLLSRKHIQNLSLLQCLKEPVRIFHILKGFLNRQKRGKNL